MKGTCGIVIRFYLFILVDVLVRVRVDPLLVFLVVAMVVVVLL